MDAFKIQKKKHVLSTPFEGFAFSEELMQNAIWFKSTKLQKPHNCTYTQQSMWPLLAIPGAPFKNQLAI